MAYSAKLSVHAGNHTRVNCPVSVDLPPDAIGNASLSLTDRSTKRRVPCQLRKTGTSCTLTWMLDKLPAGTSRSYTLRSSSVSDAPRVVLDHARDAGQVAIGIDGKPFTTYHYGDQWARPFLYPLLGPGGAGVTRGWPVVEDIPGETTDHPHHKSVWVAYGECDKVDNWAEEPGHGVQRHQRFTELMSGPVYGSVVARNHWCFPSGRKQFEETRAMRFYALPAGLRLMDVEVTFRMTEGPVVFRDTKEGGLISVRVATPMDGERGGRIENAYGGIAERETWGKKSPWCDYSGEVEGQHLGVAIFDHEDNPRYPTQWHVRDYGLMTANCFADSHYNPERKVKGDMAFKKGQKTTWKYRLYVHRGDARKGQVAGRFRDFISPPDVVIE